MPGRSLHVMAHVPCGAQSSAFVSRGRLNENIIEPVFFSTWETITGFRNNPPPAQRFRAGLVPVSLGKFRGNFGASLLKRSRPVACKAALESAGGLSRSLRFADGGIHANRAIKFRRKGAAAPRVLFGRRVTFAQRSRAATFSPKFYRAVGVDPAIGKAAESGSTRPQIPEQLCKQLAASVQQACAKVAAELAERYRNETGAKSLCLAGGLFLNPVIVSTSKKIRASMMFSFQPARETKALLWAPHGTCAITCKERPGMLRQSQLAWGRAIPARKSSNSGELPKARYRFHVSEEQILEETVQLLATGKIVGGFAAPPNSARARSETAACWLLPGRPTSKRTE